MRLTQVFKGIYLFNFILLKLSAEHDTIFDGFFHFKDRTSTLPPPFHVGDTLIAVFDILSWLHKCFPHRPGCYYFALDWTLGCRSYIICLYSGSQNWPVTQASGSLLLLNLVIDLEK